MNRLLLSAFAELLLFTCPALVRADIGPKPAKTLWLNPKPQSVKFVVAIDDGVKEPRLEVPSSLLLAPAEPGGRGDLGPRLPLVIVGFALAASFVSGGLWLTRRGRNTTALIVTIALFALGSGALLADIARPKPAPPALVEVPLPADIKLPPKITLQIVPNGTGLRLVVPSALAPKVEKPEPKPKEEQ